MENRLLIENKTKYDLDNKELSIINSAVYNIYVDRISAMHVYCFVLSLL